MKISVVIATVGSETLEGTIHSINDSTLKPDEILICIPADESKKIHFTFDNVRILKTEFRGQVSQRSYGFKCVKGDYVLQIDDDIILSPDCIEQLINTINVNEKYVVAPAMINLETGRSVYARKKYNAVIENVYGFLMNGLEGYQPGKIDKSGTAIGVDIDECGQDVVKVDWLPGGCVMHRKENLITDDFYPFKGKAFGEDVVHSYWLQNKGLSLFLDKRAKCKLEVILNIEYTFIQFIKNLCADYKVRKFLLNLKNKKSRRIYLFYALSLLSYIVNVIKKKIQ